MLNKLDGKKKIGLGLGLVGIVVAAFIFWPSSKSSEENAIAQTMGIESMSEQEISSIEQVDGVLNVEHWTTAEGLRVYYVNSPNLPMVDVDVVIDAGSARDGDKPGLAFLTSQLLSEGSPEMNADEFAEALESLGVQASFNSKRDMATIEIRSLTDAEILPKAIELIQSILVNPTFDAKGFAREQQNMAKLLDYESQQPKKIAERAFYAKLYKDQPYGSWPHGSQESVAALTREDLVSFHQQYYVLNNMAVTIVGAVSRDDANAIAEKLTQGLPKGEKAPKLDPIQAPTEKQVERIIYPSEQSHILMGLPGLTRGDEDYIPLMVGNHILGGSGMVSRLFESVRNDQGLAYSVYSYFIPMAQQGPFILGCQTKNASAQKAMDLIDQQLRDFVEQGPSDEELAKAKQNLLGGFSLRFDSNASISSYVTVMAFYDLPINFYDDYYKSIEQVNLEQIKTAFKNRIDADKLTVVSVGGE